MRKFLLLSVVLLFGIVAMVPGRAQAVIGNDPLSTHTTYGTEVDRTLWEAYYIQWGSPVSGMVATNNGNPDQLRGWDNDGTTLAWFITDNLDGGYTYEYTWTTLDNDLSHIIIEFTDGITRVDQISVPNAEYDIMTNTAQQGNPGIPADLYGIKIDLDDDYNTTNYTLWFTTEQAPVWGNFYAKDGDPIYAYNTGFDGHPDFSDRGVFIPRPDGASVPEPATMLLLGAGLIGLATVGRKKFFKKA